MNISSIFQGKQSHLLFDAYASAFIQYFSTHKKVSAGFPGISGRILRGKVPFDFKTLTDNPSRKIVFLSDERLLAAFIGLSGREILETIGYPAEQIDAYIAQGTQFKLALFSSFSMQVADWDNLLDMVMLVYPAWRERIATSRLTLKTTSYQTLHEQMGDPFLVRKFLEETINVNPLFAGDGYVRNGVMSEKKYTEYITLNKRLDKFPDYCLISFPLA